MTFNALLLRIGFMNAQANAIIAEGISDPSDLVTYAHSDVKTFSKHLANRGIHPPFRVQHKFQIVRYWVEKRTPLGLPVIPDLFTDEKLLKWGEKMKVAADEKDGQKPTIPAPDALKKNI